ncbi:MAG: cytochrome c [Chitinophagales bacterium]
MHKRDFLIILLTSIAAYFLGACQSSGDFTGREYMPDMTHSKAYEPYVEGRTVIIDGDSVQLFPNNQAALKPVAGTVARGYVPYYFENTAEGYERAGQELVSPLDRRSETVLKEGKVAYEINCAVCHGAGGKADGSIVKNGAYPAPPPSYFREDILVLPEGKMFHSVHYGKNLMGSYASQLTKEERWNVIAYIKSMQAKQIEKDYKVSLDDAYKVALGNSPIPTKEAASETTDAATDATATDAAAGGE